jgi:hypothetical protein
VRQELTASEAISIFSFVSSVQHQQRPQTFTFMFIFFIDSPLPFAYFMRTELRFGIRDIFDSQQVGIPIFLSKGQEGCHAQG